MIEPLYSASEVISALGGMTKAAAILNERPATVGNWQTRGRIPAEQFLKVSRALGAIGLTASPDIFGMKAGEGRELIEATGSRP